MYDISIIGAGIIGSAIARELAKYQLKICLIEKNEDVGAETTKANSGIVHGGYADKPGSNKAQFCTKGNLLYKKLNEELNFGFNQTGSFVIGFNEQDAKKIEQLYSFGQKNGVPNLQIVDGDFVKKREPNLNPEIKIALYCPTAGITSPYEFAIALAENSVENGVELKLNSKVIEIQKLKDHFLLTTTQEKIATKIVINAAGLYADEIAQMIGLKEFNITPRAGQYLLFDKDEGEQVNSVIFQTPSEISKGILVTRTYYGNLLMGPDATPAPSKDYLDTTTENIKNIIATAKKSLPKFDLRKVITSFAGNRAISSTGDFIMGESKIQGFINVAGIESPGLTAAPAIADHVVKIIAKNDQLKLIPNKNFNPYREPQKSVANMEEAKLSNLVKKEPDYGQIVCRCENVSLGEIHSALKKNIPVKSLDAISRRTRTCMGRCQGGFCTPKIMEIISKELNIPKEKITKKGGESFLVVDTVSGTDSVQFHEIVQSQYLTPNSPNYDLVIIGGGPAGMAAALSAHYKGINKILIIERDKKLGGILTQCIHNTFGLRLFKEELSGPEYSRRVTKELLKTNVEVITETMVLKIENKTIHAINKKDGYLKIDTKAIILAMGCRERTRGAIGISGSRPAGVYTAGTAQKLINTNGLLPGKEAVILGSGDVGLIAARRISLMGAKVKAVFEILPHSSGLARNITECLDEFNIPLVLNTTITKIHGNDRVEGVSIAKVNDQLQPIPSTEEFIPCDTVLLSVGLIPENELSRKAKIDIDQKTQGPVVGELRQTNKDGIFACGNVLQVQDLVDFVSEDGTLAGIGAAKYINQQLYDGSTHTINTTDDINYIVPQKINVENIDDKIEFFMRVKKPFVNKTINVYLGNKIIATKKEEKFLPSRLINIEIDKKDLPKGNEKEIMVKICK